MNADYEKAGYDKAESPPSLAPALLVTGCTSDAGKSVVVAGMCRSLARRDYRVAPFKAQNMSNNSAVVLATDYSAGAGISDSGEAASYPASHHENGRRLVAGEIGRAQALQAFAAGVTPSVDMNPVLLKPEADRRSQLVLRGGATGTVGARDTSNTAHTCVRSALKRWSRSAANTMWSSVKGRVHQQKLTSGTLTSRTWGWQKLRIFPSSLSAI